MSRVDLTPMSFKRQIRQEALDEWNGRYVGGTSTSVTKVYFPDAIAAHRIVRKMRLDPTLVQIMTGHGGFSSYLHRFKCKESPSCICNDEVEETVLHIVTECPVYGRQRFDAESELGVEITESTIREIIKHKCGREKFVKFYKQVILSVVNKNK